jgi:hypothetical protein
MRRNYTRQRQGRAAYPAQRALYKTLLEEVNHLRNAELSVEGNYNNIDGVIGNAPKKDDYEEKTLLEQIEYNRAVSKRNAAPVDGCEPQERNR